MHVRFNLDAAVFPHNGTLHWQKGIFDLMLISTKSLWHISLACHSIIVITLYSFKVSVWCFQTLLRTPVVVGNKKSLHSELARCSLSAGRYDTGMHCSNQN